LDDVKLILPSWLRHLLAVALVAFPGFAALPAHAGTLEAVRTRGTLVCGVTPDHPGLSAVDRFGRWTGIAVEFCRAVAAAVLGDHERLKLEPVSAIEAVKGLGAGTLDIAITESSWTLSRDTEFNSRYVDVLLYDGQGFMVPRSHGLASALELSGALVCVVEGTRAFDAAKAFFGSHRMRVQMVTSESWQDVISTYGAGGCTALSGDLTLLAEVRRGLARPNDHQLLPEVISKAPIAPAVRIGDDRWFAIVRWVLMSLIAAEELEITSGNVSSRASSPDEDIRRLAGGADLGETLGLSADWTRKVISSVGNYGEIYDRTLGMSSPFLLPRGQNNVWSKGGLMYAVPLR